LGVITDQPPESGVRVAIWVAVHRRSAQFNGVRAHGLSCGANATEPRGTCSAQALIRRFRVRALRPPTNPEVICATSALVASRRPAGAAMRAATTVIRGLPGPKSEPAGWTPTDAVG